MLSYSSLTFVNYFGCACQEANLVAGAEELKRHILNAAHAEAQRIVEEANSPKKVGQPLPASVIKAGKLGGTSAPQATTGVRGGKIPNSRRRFVTLSQEEEQKLENAATGQTEENHGGSGATKEQHAITGSVEGEAAHRVPAAATRTKRKVSASASPTREIVGNRKPKQTGVTVVGGARKRMRKAGTFTKSVSSPTNTAKDDVRGSGSRRKRKASDVESERDGPMNTAFSGYSEGQRVEGNFNGDGEWYSGVIAKVHPDGAVDINYDDGDKEGLVPPLRVRLENSGSDANDADGNADADDKQQTDAKAPRAGSSSRKQSRKSGRRSASTTASNDEDGSISNPDDDGEAEAPKKMTRRATRRSASQGSSEGGVLQQAQTILSFVTKYKFCC